VAAREAEHQGVLRVAGVERPLEDAQHVLDGWRVDLVAVDL